MRIEKTVAHGESRKHSLDQFRGYTVVGMFFVNYLGMFAAIHPIFKHHDTYCSYADTIMPQFFFAVGFAYRLTMLKAVEREGSQAYRHAIRRNLTLVVIGEIIYGLNPLALFRMASAGDVLSLLAYPFRAGAFQALTHIGVTGLWILPVIARSGRVRLIFMIVSGAAHLGLSKLFWYDYLWANGAIDGGQLGFLSWTIPAIIGSFAYDWTVGKSPTDSVPRLLFAAIAVMALGYLISCGNAINHCIAGTPGAQCWATPPFVPPVLATDIWTMSQKAGSISYLTFGAGFSLLIFALFVRISDAGAFRPGLFRTLGQNALVAYLLGGAIQGLTQLPMNSAMSVSLALGGFLTMLTVTFLIMRFMDRKGIHIRL